MDLEAAQVLLDEWKWRHQHCWKSLQRFGLAAITVAIIPYAKADPFQSKLGRGMLVFPLASWLLAVAATWLFAAEYIRCRPVETKYYDLLGDEYRPVSRQPSNNKLRGSIGRSTIAVFLVGATIISIANAEVLIHVADLQHRIWIGTRIIFALAFLVASLALAWGLTDWAAREINKLIEKVKPEDSKQ